MKCECGGEQEIQYGLMFRKWVVCKACGRPMSFNLAVCRAAFPIEPMPPGAVAFYEGDLDVASLVLDPDPTLEPDKA